MFKKQKESYNETRAALEANVQRYQVCGVGLLGVTAVFIRVIRAKYCIQELNADGGEKGGNAAELVRLLQVF